MVDRLDLKSSDFDRVGSSPSSGTWKIIDIKIIQIIKKLEWILILLSHMKILKVKK